MSQESFKGPSAPQKKVPFMSDYAINLDHVYSHWSKPPSDDTEDIDEFEIYQRASLGSRCFELQDIEMHVKQVGINHLKGNNVLIFIFCHHRILHHLPNDKEDTHKNSRH